MRSQGSRKTVKELKEIYNETACSYCLKWYPSKSRHKCKVPNLHNVIDRLDQKLADAQIELDRRRAKRRG